MNDRHRHRPISFRPSEADRKWLIELAEVSHRPLRSLLADALSHYRSALESGTEVNGLRLSYLNVAGQDLMAITGTITDPRDSVKGQRK